jgi:hypothetical protein
LLNVLIARLRNLDSHIERKDAGFNGRDEPFLALFQKGPDHMNIFNANADLWRNFAVAVPAATQGADVLQQVDRPMLASCTVFNETHDQAIAFLGLDDNGRDFRLTELDERFNSTLTANEIIACRVRLTLSRANGDRTLEPDIGDALYYFLKISTISDPRV